ncbi:MAG: hypothetical protein ABI416_08100 [Ginsengibacter sp.]
MKKDTILAALMVLTIIACTIFISDGLTWLITPLMALTIGGIIHYNRQKVMKMTRWAKANPGKAQVFITVAQIALMALGIFAGNNLKEIGYEFSNTTAYVFGTIIVIGFLSVPFLPKRNAITIPKVVNRRRLAYLGITLSSFVMMAVFGNRLESDYPDSSLTYAVRAIDNVIFQDKSLSRNGEEEAAEPAYDRNERQALTGGSSNIAVSVAYTIYDKETITPYTLSKKDLRKAERKIKRFERNKQKMMELLNKRLAMEGVTGVAAVLLIILLVITTCAGICLMILGATAGSVILGALIAGGSIFGIVKIAQGKKRKPKTEP